MPKSSDTNLLDLNKLRILNFSDIEDTSLASKLVRGDRYNVHEWCYQTFSHLSRTPTFCNPNTTLHSCGFWLYHGGDDKDAK